MHNGVGKTVRTGGQRRLGQNSIFWSCHACCIPKPAAAVIHTRLNSSMEKDRVHEPPFCLRNYRKLMASVERSQFFLMVLPLASRLCSTERLHMQKYENIYGSLCSRGKDIDLKGVRGSRFGGEYGQNALYEIIKELI